MGGPRRNWPVSRLEPVPLTTLRAGLVGLQPDIVALIHACLTTESAKRPRMADVQTVLARRLLENEHRALVVMDGQAYSLDRKNRRITLNAGAVGSLTIEYDGFDFKISGASGAVSLNNSAAQAGSVVPGCCVITFGVGTNRRFVTFDVSHPEVMP